MGRSGDKASTASVSYRRADDLSEVTREWNASGIDELDAAAPWRTFRWHRGQKHYSGPYWSSTVGGHIIYESRLELARLLFADFDSGDPTRTGTRQATQRASVRMRRAAMVRRKQVYKMTYPNGKVYVVMDLTGSRLYLDTRRRRNGPSHQWRRRA